MKQLTQHFIGDDGTEDFYITHIYSESGYFTKRLNGRDFECGWHIQIGSADSPKNYTEHKGTASREIPAELPDVIYHILTPEEMAEIEAEQMQMQEDAL